MCRKLTTLISRPQKVECGRAQKVTPVDQRNYHARAIERIAAASRSLTSQEPLVNATATQAAPCLLDACYRGRHLVNPVNPKATRKQAAAELHAGPCHSSTGMVPRHGLLSRVLIDTIPHCVSCCARHPSPAASRARSLPENKAASATATQLLRQPTAKVAARGST